MADIERDMTERRGLNQQDAYLAQRSGTSGWWIAGLLALAVMIIGFLALSGGNPAPVEPASTGVETPAEPGMVPLDAPGT